MFTQNFYQDFSKSTLDLDSFQMEEVIVLAADSFLNSIPNFIGTFITLLTDNSPPIKFLPLFKCFFKTLFLKLFYNFLSFPEFISHASFINALNQTIESISTNSLDSTIEKVAKEKLPLLQGNAKNLAFATNARSKAMGVEIFPS
jgi:hypothetical protein